MTVPKPNKIAWACPICFCEETSVYNSRHHQSGDVWRYRECRKCESRWSTKESFIKLVKRKSVVTCRICDEIKRRTLFPANSKFCYKCLARANGKDYLEKSLKPEKVETKSKKEIDDEIDAEIRSAREEAMLYGVGKRRG